MKAKNCIRGVKVKTKVEPSELYYVDVISKSKHYRTNSNILNGTLGKVVCGKPDSVGDTVVRFGDIGNIKDIVVNAKCLSKVKE